MNRFRTTSVRCSVRGPMGVSARWLTPIVYDQLHRLAHYHLKRERAGHSLQTTALVNEAYLRLVDFKRMRWQNRAHVLAVSAQAMPRILAKDHDTVSCRVPPASFRT